VYSLYVIFISTDNIFRYFKTKESMNKIQETMYRLTCDPNYTVENPDNEGKYEGCRDKCGRMYVC